MLNVVLKGSCLAVYLLAVVGIVVELPFGITSTVQYGAAILLAAHALEALVAFRSVKHYEGPLWVSVLLTLLFGFLHWLPLAREHVRAAK
jgi:hypothetical protein